MQVSPASRSRLGEVGQRFPALAAFQLEFQRITELHPIAHIAKRFPTGFRQAACGADFQGTHTTPAPDGLRVCGRCARWFRIRTGEKE